MLSDKQILFRDYLIKKLGFVAGDFLSSYLNSLESAAPQLKYLGALPAIFETQVNENGEEEQVLKGADKFKKYEGKNGMYVPSNSNILDFLNKEYKTKKEKLVSYRENFTEYISATDLSSYSYCPVNFLIQKTFETTKIQSAYIGTDLHEEKRLSTFLAKRTLANATEGKVAKNPFLKPENKDFFDDIYTSTLVYAGHDKNNTKKYFKSAKGKYAGQPDYIFKNQNGEHFVVEEKFHFEGMNRYNSENKFYKNHLHQLFSYLHWIPDYEIKYGYLIYWKYELDYGTPTVCACNVKKVTKDELSRQEIISIYLTIKQLMAGEVLNFDIAKRNPHKCANCVSNLICGHKTGKFSTISFPYSLEYLRTCFVEFPKELKKDYIAENPDEIKL